MPVVGWSTYIMSDTGRIANINPFTSDYDSMLISIVDAAVGYGWPYNGQKYISVIRDPLIVPLMHTCRTILYPIS